jgi:hypothetical protein
VGERVSGRAGELGSGRAGKRVSGRVGERASWNERIGVWARGWVRVLAYRCQVCGCAGVRACGCAGVLLSNKVLTLKHGEQGKSQK